MYKQIEQNITSAFVYGYLLERGYSGLAQKLQKCRQIPDLHGLRLEDLVLFHKKLNYFRRTETEVFTDQIVIRYLKAKGHYKLAKKLMKTLGCTRLNPLAPSESLENILEIFYRDKQLNDSRVTLKERFLCRIDETCRVCQGNTDMNKALIFVISSEQKIFEATADAVKVNLPILEDQIRYPKSHVSIVSRLNRRKFSLSTSGPESDELKIIKAWKELLTASKILNENQLLLDLYQLANSKDQWISSIVGCYLSKYLSTPRHPMKVFVSLHHSLLYRTGVVDKSEDEVLWDYINENKSRSYYDLNYLQTMIKRPRYYIRKHLELLLDERTRKYV